MLLKHPAEGNTRVLGDWTKRNCPWRLVKSEEWFLIQYITNVFMSTFALPILNKRIIQLNDSKITNDFKVIFAHLSSFMKSTVQLLLMLVDGQIQ